MYIKSHSILYLYLFFNRFYLFLGREEGREKEREISVCQENIHQLLLECSQMGTWPTTQACALTRNRTSNALVRRPALNPLSHTSQGHMVYFKFIQFYLSLVPQ